MRTTIRLPDTHREKLLELAAERGERGCGRVVEDAVAFYLTERDRPRALPPYQPETRAERAWVVLGWMWDEAVGLMGFARSKLARLRASA
jgi:hypothetical protein